MSRKNQNTYAHGDWNAICDQCGFKFKASELRKRWDGFMVCEPDWEPRHPQDFVRAVKDEQKVPWTRSEPSNTFVTTTQNYLPGEENPSYPGTFGGYIGPCHVEITSPLNAADVSGTVSVDVTATAASNATLRRVTVSAYREVDMHEYVLADATHYGDESVTLNISWDTSAVLDGNYLLVATVSDTTGTSAVSAQPHTVSVSNAGISVEITSPTDGQTLGNTNLNVIYTVAAPAGLKYTRLYVDGALNSTFDAFAVLGFYPTSGAGVTINGTHANDCTSFTIQLVVEDTLGNFASSDILTVSVCY